MSECRRATVVTMSISRTIIAVRSITRERVQSDEEHASPRRAPATAMRVREPPRWPRSRCRIRLHRQPEQEFGRSVPSVRDLCSERGRCCHPRRRCLPRQRGCFSHGVMRRRRTSRCRPLRPRRRGRPHVARLGRGRAVPRRVAAPWQPRRRRRRRMECRARGSADGARRGWRISRVPLIRQSRRAARADAEIRLRAEGDTLARWLRRDRRRVADGTGARTVPEIPRPKNAVLFRGVRAR
jgi:hypothetical protein